VATVAKDPFSVMCKPVGARCNLRCSYCYYLDTASSTGGGPALMSDDVLEAFIRQYIEGNPAADISFVWHGGEPALAGIDFYRKALTLQRKYLLAGKGLPAKRVWNNLQTNGVLLDEAFCDFLAAERFDVGLSIDGTAPLHDANRKDGAGRGSYEAAVAACRRLRERGIRSDLLCTVNSATAEEPLAVYRALRALGTGWIQFIPIVIFNSDGTVNPLSVEPEAYGAFLSTVFAEWYRCDQGKVDVQLFSEVAAVFAGKGAGLCWMAPRCGRALLLESDGRLYACDHYVRPPYCRGSILERPLPTLADSPAQKAFGRRKTDALPQKCRRCPWLKLCNGACPKDRLPNGENYLCSGLSSFFTYAAPKIAALL
jgi:uncharacterized protein